MRTCAAKVQLPSECRISHSSQSTYFDAVVLVRQWAKQLRDHPSSGLRAFRSRHRPGRPSRLSAAQWHSILKTLRKGALKAGFETDRWTLRRIRDLIRRQFGVAYHPNYLAARLRASGWSPQIPAVHAKERNEEVIRAWLEQDWPRIRKKLGWQTQLE